MSQTPDTRSFEIWSEGWVATGQSNGATNHGMVFATTFKQACDKLAACNPDFAKYYDPKRMTYWGCRLFDNQTDARKSFG